MAVQSTKTVAEHAVVHNTFVLKRSYSAKAERVWAMLSNPEKRKRWHGEGEGHDVESFELDFRVGGSLNSSYRFREGSPFPGAKLSNTVQFLDVVEPRRVVESGTMALNGNNFSASLVTFELVPTATGTDLVLTHQGAFFEGADGPEMRKQGWTTLLDQLSKALQS